MTAIQALPMPHQDRIARLFADMIAEKKAEMNELPPRESSTPYERRRRDMLLLQVANLRGDLRRHRLMSSR